MSRAWVEKIEGVQGRKWGVDSTGCLSETRENEGRNGEYTGRLESCQPDRAVKLE